MDLSWQRGDHFFLSLQVLAVVMLSLCLSVCWQENSNKTVDEFWWYVSEGWHVISNSWLNVAADPDYDEDKEILRDFYCLRDRGSSTNFATTQKVVNKFLHCALSLAVQCIVIGPVCLQWVGWRTAFVGRSVNRITWNCVRWSSPNWVCR